MIDFIKAFADDVHLCTLQSNKQLHFKSVVSERTGEIYPQSVAKYNVLEFTSTGHWLHLKGSIHKFKNEGKYNYDDFTYSMLVDVIHELQSLLQINSHHLALENIEFGVNIIPEWDTSLILDNLIGYKTTKFQDIPIRGGYYKAAYLDDFRVKIYDKGIQYYLPENLLRFELHCNKMRHISQTGIKTVGDLLDKDKLILLKPILLKAWEQLMLFDWTIDKEKAIQAVGKDLYYQMQMYSYWQNWDNRKRYKIKDKYNRRLVIPLAEGVHEAINKQIADKFDYLLSN